MQPESTEDAFEESGAEPQSRAEVARSVIKAGGKAMLGSLALSALVMGPGFALLFAGYQLSGMIWLFLAAFGLMARTYRKPWRLGVISCLLPPLTAAACYAFQIWLFGEVAPLEFVAIAVTLGLLIGYFRARSHTVRHDDKGAPIADRTFGYLLIWVIAYGATQAFAYFAINSIQTRAGLVTGAFSTAMLVAVSVIIWVRFRAIKRGAAALLAAMLVPALALAPATSDPASAQGQAGSTPSAIETLEASLPDFSAEVRTLMVGMEEQDLSWQMEQIPGTLKGDDQSASVDYRLNFATTGGSEGIGAAQVVVSMSATRFPSAEEATPTPKSGEQSMRSNLGSSLLSTDGRSFANARAHNGLFRIESRVRITGRSGQAAREDPSEFFNSGGETLPALFSVVLAKNLKPTGQASSGDITATTPVCPTLNGTYIPMRGDPMELARKCVGGPTSCADIRIQRGDPDFACPWVTADQGAGAGQEDGTGDGIPLVDQLGTGGEPTTAEEQDAILETTAAITAALVAAGIAVSTAQAIAAAIANALQAGAQMTAEDIQAAIMSSLGGKSPDEDTDDGGYPDQSDDALEDEPPPDPPPEEEAEEESEEEKQAAREREEQERREREKREWEEEQARRKAEAQRLDKIQDLAVELGDQDLIDRTVSERIYNPDGTVNSGYLDKLQGILRQRLRREGATSDPDFEDNSWQRIVRESGRETFDEASDSMVIRAGTGILSGGTSEAFFQGGKIINKVEEAAHSATDKGTEMSRTDALRITATEFANDNLPVNTANAINRIRKGENVSWTELGTSMFADAMALVDVGEAGGKITGVKPGDALDAAARRALPSSTYERGADAVGKAGETLGNVISKVQDANSAATNSARRGLNRAGELVGIDGLGNKSGLRAPDPTDTSRGSSHSRMDPDDARGRLERGEVEPSTASAIEETRSSGTSAELDNAHQSGRQRGEGKVEAFENSVSRLEEARASGDPEAIARAQRDVRNDMIRVQSDKHAMNALNGRNVDGAGHGTIESFNSEMGATHAQTDAAVRQRIADEYGVRPEDVQVVNITNEAGGGQRVSPESPGRPTDPGLASTRTPDGSVQNSRGARSEPGTIDGPETGRLPDPEAAPPRRDKAGMDRDMTMRVRTVVQTPDGPRVVYRDVPSTVTGRHYNEEWYRAATGRDPPPFDGSGYNPNHSTDFADVHLDEGGFVGDPTEITDPQAFARRTDQATTDRLHPEAYGTGQADLNAATKDSYRHVDLSDVGGTARTIEYKVDHWMIEANRLQEMAAKPGNASVRAELLEQASAHMEEAQRQLVKQYGNMVVTRTEAMRMFGNAPNAQIPKALGDKVGVLRQVQQGKLTPALAEETLKRMGSSTQDVARQMSAYVEGLEKLRPTGLPSSGGRAPIQRPPFQGWQDEFGEDKR